ncbi:MAG: hypothetical protein WBJ68_10665 [Candidatus Dechloromonas phosphoritropha]
MTATSGSDSGPYWRSDEKWKAWGLLAHLLALLLAQTRFAKVVDDNGAMLIWTFNFRAARRGGGEMQVIRGVSHLKFDAAGKVDYHRDYWDAAEELYMKLPVLGMLMRGLRRTLAALAAGMSPPAIFTPATIRPTLHQ